MSKAVKVQGIECPIIREGDNIVDIVVEILLKKCDTLGFPLKDEEDGHFEYVYDLHDKDILGLTESIVARAAGQYITVDDIAADIDKKFGKGATIALINPIYSRNRFSLILKGIARSASKVIIVMPDYDEVGNPRGVNPFTGVNIEEYYKELCESENCECEIRDEIIDTDRIGLYDNVIYCGLHNYSTFYHDTYLYIFEQCKKYTLADICSDKSPDWGVLGTNKATEEKLKLFPSKTEAQRVCDEVKTKIKEKTGKDVIVCTYGDGCFKDPVGGIWEMADPVTMPAYTDKELMESSPQELKLKLFIDQNEDISPIPDSAIDQIHNTNDFKYSVNYPDSYIRQGTTPRIYRDLLASLMDLTSGSGDRATPVVLVQNYF